MGLQQIPHKNLIFPKNHVLRYYHRDHLCKESAYCREVLSHQLHEESCQSDHQQMLQGRNRSQRNRVLSGGVII